MRFGIMTHLPVHLETEDHNPTCQSKMNSYNSSIQSDSHFLPEMANHLVYPEARRLGEKLKGFVSLLLIIILAILAGFYFYQKNQKDRNLTGFLSQYQQFDAYQKINNDPLLFSVSKESKEIGYLLFEAENGYQSTITLATVIDKDGKIIDVRIYSQNETPAFIKRIENLGFLERAFKGKSIKNGFREGVNIDGISRATITSRAITKIVHKSSRFIGAKYLDINVTKLYQVFDIGWIEIALLVMFLLALIANRLKKKKFRLLVLLYSVMVIGFTFSQFLTFSMFFSGFTGNWPSIYESVRWYLLVIGVLGLNLITGKNMYCAYMCPFGAIQELEYRIAGVHFFKVSPEVTKVLRYAPVTIVYFSLVTVFLTQAIGAMNYEPFSLLFGRLGTDVQWVLLPLTLFPALFIQRFFCNYGCPVGYLLKLVLRVRRNLEKLWKRKVQKIPAV